MWRRTYLLLLLVRVYFALSPSYLHPDENFQGPEVFAGRTLSYPSRLPWEFTSNNPIRSVFPLWPVYNLPMNLLKWFYAELETGNPSPPAVYYFLRGVMFFLSFVLEDWAVYELVPFPRHRRAAVVLVASSYVTWTYQTHTFSNSIETLLVAWGLVLIRRIVEQKRRSSIFSCVMLSLIAVAGVFNRITFPAFLLIPGLQLLPHFWRRPISLLVFAVFGIFFCGIAIIVDTRFYHPSASVWDALHAPVVTPLNNLRYNTNTSNLALHGLHPHYQHFLVNLPQLLGPALVAMVLSFWNPSAIPSWLKTTQAVSALSGTAMLSIFPHQEPRFLIPCVPLLLSCFRMRKSRVFLTSWIIFNAALGFLMGVYHQGGVVPVQLAIPSIISANVPKQEDVSGKQPGISATVLWWKTYSPPLWLLGNNTSSQLDIETRDLMGISGPEMARELESAVPSCTVKPASDTSKHVFVVAPNSATFLDRYTSPSADPSDLELHELWSYRKHINLDDLDIGDDGLIPTLRRVVGRRGLNVWIARRARCP
ncbi:glycosylphosphatidylinositol-alpha 1,2 mannosyltransferase smp3 [Aspergillus clavatus NRRL 1]|uniref:Mannosyltransferase n=1 Tax=Aspergillus clavatus (strain ATCC 1007 / CBS 513.65 / DSM 816 / NCTC 3887 / NRRL 1 / QM 1276 / 107) TaxID=344612 RepID=A1C9U4_ASPCL|nr:mannosyltransferase (Smp3), putative [Aspergillus clavatus NRRL 1]EAW12512.1 mannosyltransferase (Smp3), putative [Aspergillus clavatus NRRL 1]